MDKLGWGKADLVKHGELYAKSLGLKEFPEVTPKTIYSLGLQNTPVGLKSTKRIARKPSPQSSASTDKNSNKNPKPNLSKSESLKSDIKATRSSVKANSTSQNKTQKKK